jgi:hypothetical protein
MSNEAFEIALKIWQGSRDSADQNGNGVIDSGEIPRFMSELVTRMPCPHELQAANLAAQDIHQALDRVRERHRDQLRLDNQNVAFSDWLTAQSPIVMGVLARNIECTVEASRLERESGKTPSR